MAQGRFPIHFPQGGLHRALAYQNQPPYTTPDALNVRPQSTIEGRMRGGQRPGIAKEFLTPVGGPVRMLANVRVVPQTANNIWQDLWKEEFSGSSLGPEWSNPDWVEGYPIDPFYWMNEPPAIMHGAAMVGEGMGTLGGGAFHGPVDIDVTQPYRFHMLVQPNTVYAGAHNAASYYFFLMLPDDGPSGAAELSAVAIEVRVYTEATHTDRYISVGGYVYHDLTYHVIFTDETPFEETETSWALITLEVTNDQLTVMWRGTIVETTILPLIPAGKRFGFGLTTNNLFGFEAEIAEMSLEYYAPSESGLGGVNRDLLVVSGNGKLYRDSGGPLLMPLTPGPRKAFCEETAMQAVGRGQKLYIANWRPTPWVEDAGVFVDEPGEGYVLKRSGHATGDDFAVVEDHVKVWGGIAVEILAATTGIEEGYHYPTDIAEDCSWLKFDPSPATQAGSCNIRVMPAPKVYDPLLNELTLWRADEGKGVVPVNCSIITRYRDRLPMAGQPEHPHVWYMPRMGAPNDFDYGRPDTDVGRAFVSSNSEAGDVGEPITAMIPHTDDYLIFGCTRSLWVLAGDPTYRGELNNLSREVGILDRFAFCYGPNSETIFLTHLGLYFLPPGARAYPAPMSKARLPRELVGINTSTHEALLAYDVRGDGINIYIASRESGMAEIHWWYDVVRDSLWPMQLQLDHEPSVVGYRERGAGTSVVSLIGGRDGGIRSYDYNLVTDSGHVIPSFLLYGPIAMGGIDREGRLSELTGALAEGNCAVLWRVYAGNTAEAAYLKYTLGTPDASGRWSSGPNPRSLPRVRGAVMFLELASTAEGDRWAVESITAKVLPAGPIAVQ